MHLPCQQTHQTSLDVNQNLPNTFSAYSYSFTSSDSLRILCQFPRRVTAKVRGRAAGLRAQLLRATRGAWSGAARGAPAGGLGLAGR